MTSTVLRNLLLLVCVAGFLYVHAADDDKLTSAQKVAAAKKCFKEKGIDIEAEIKKAKACSKHLPDKKDWNLEFCQEVKGGHLPCMDEIKVEDLKQCLKPESVELLMKSLQMMFSRICEVAANAPKS